MPEPRRGAVTIRGVPGATVPAGTLFRAPDGTAFLSEAVVIGADGSATASVTEVSPEALQALQRANRLTPDGKLGPRTLAKLQAKSSYELITSEDDWWT